jgi:hypothetical protein
MQVHLTTPDTRREIAIQTRPATNIVKYMSDWTVLEELLAAGTLTRQDCEAGEVRYQ